MPGPSSAAATDVVPVRSLGGLFLPCPRQGRKVPIPGEGWASPRRAKGVRFMCVRGGRPDGRGKWFALVVLCGTILYTWPAVYWLGPRHWSATASIAAVLLLCVEYNRRYSRSSGEWGFSWRDFLPGLRLVLIITTPAMIAIAYTGWSLGSLIGRKDPTRDLIGLFLWALAQQFVLQTLLLRELRGRFGGWRAVMAAAALFALLHLPNPLLVPLTFAGGLIWCGIYTRHPNLLPLALSHSLVTLMILASLSRSVTGGMRVGYSYLLLSG